MTQIEEKSKAEAPPNEEKSGAETEAAVKVQSLMDKILAHKACRYCMDAASMTLSLAVIVLGTFSILMSRPSVNLDILTPATEDWFKGAFAGRTAEIETYTARWIQETQSFEIVATNIDVSGLDGVHQGIAEMRAEFALIEGLRHKPELKNLYIEGGALTISRDREGLVQVGLGTPETFMRVAPLWTSQTDGIKSGNVDRIDRIVVKGVSVYMRDEIPELELSIKDVTGSYVFDGQNIKVDSVGEVLSGETYVPYMFNMRTVPDRSVFSAEFSIDGVRPLEIAPKSGRFAKLARLDAPVTLHAEVKSTSAGLQDLKIDLSAGEGRLKTGQTYKPFTSAQIKARYDVPAQSVALSLLDIRSEALNIEAEGMFKDVGAVGSGFLRSPVLFDLAINTFRVNPGEKYDGPIVMKTGALQGQLDRAKGTLAFDKLDLDFGDFQTDFTGLVSRGPDNILNAINIDGKILGVLNKENLLSFWPNDFGLGARNWMVKSLQAADFSDLDLHLAMDAEDIRTKYIANDHLKLDYKVANVDIRYLRQMPWLRESGGYGTLKGNEFTFQVVGGHVDGLTVEHGSVVIPRLVPKGGDFTVEFTGNGPLREMLRVSNFEPLQYADRFKLTPSEFAGEGQIHLKITRPLLEYFDKNRIVSELDGQFTGVVLPSGFGKFKLNDGALSIHADSEGAEIMGPIKVGKWQANLDWRKTFAEDSTTAGNYTLSGILNRNDLDNFGVGLRRHFGGEIALSILGGGSQVDAQTLNVTADFINADVNIGGLWNKAVGEEGRLSGTLVLSEDEGGRLDDFKITSPGLALEGSVALADDYRLRSLDITKTYIDGFIDATLQATPTDTGVLNLNVAGKYLNIETWVDKAFKTQSSSVSAPIFMTADLETLALDEHYTLQDAVAVFSHSGMGVDHAKLAGMLPDGPFLAEISHQEDRDSEDGSTVRNVHVEIPDAAKAAVTFLGVNSIRGGTLTIDGTLPPTSEAAGVSGKVVLSDFVLVRAPAFTKILSLASLQGMADTLSGNGMQFNTLEMDFAIDDGVFKVRNGHASGPALGLTGEGDIGFADKTLDFNGVLVPAYTMNSILADIPIIGDIMVGKKGEGIFALNYAVKGPFRATQVSVNPLSALTPGFLRRIFDVERDDILAPEVEELIEKQRKN